MRRGCLGAQQCRQSCGEPPSHGARGGVVGVPAGVHPTRRTGRRPHARRRHHVGRAELRAAARRVDGRPSHLQHGVALDGEPTFRCAATRLFASLWSNGSVADHNSATDADSDIALALLFAARRFDDPALHEQALTVLDAIWQDDVTSIGGMNVLTAATGRPDPASHRGRSSTPRTSRRTRTGRSRVEDPAHPWSSLIDSSYTLLDECSHGDARRDASVGLPPNWCAISRATGQVVSFPHDRERRRLRLRRLPGHVARGGRRALERRAARPRLPRRKRLPARAVEQRPYGSIPSTRHDGNVVSSYDDPTVYGGDIGNFVVTDPAGAAQIEQRAAGLVPRGVACVLRRSAELLRTELGMVRPRARRRCCSSTWIGG